MSETLAIVAGKGGLPLLAAQNARGRGFKTVAVCFDDSVKETVSPHVDDIRLHGIGQAGKSIKFFKDSGAKRILFIGKIEKKLAFRDLLLDGTGMKIMAKAATKSDSKMMLSILEAVEAAGLTVERQTEWLPDAMPSAGVLGKHQPTEEARGDIDFGLPLCKELAGRDVGQTLLVKEGTVIAVEAVEGTDETIKRAGSLASGCVMLKCSRPKQDLRFDIPAVGPKTIESLKAASATTLAIEAGGVVVAEMEEMIAAADKAGIAVVAV